MTDAIRSKLPAAARIVLGLVFFVFGLNGFLQFMPQPPLPEPAGAFMGALAATGYMFPLIKGTEVAAGLLLLGGRFVPLALEGYLAWAYRDAFAGVLQPNARPATGSASAVVRPAVASSR